MRWSSIWHFVLKISKNELKNYFKDFEIIKTKKGRKIEYLEFKFTPEKKYKEDIISDENDENKEIVKNKSQKVKRKIPEKKEIIQERKVRIVEAPPKIEKEKTLREKIQEKIEINNMEIVRLKAMYEGLKDKIQFKKMIDQYPEKIQKIKDMNMQLEAIYEVDEENFTQEIIELAEELIKNKV